MRRGAFGAVALAGALALAASAVAPMATLAQSPEAEASAPAMGEAVTVGTATDDLGTYLVGPEGMTLYFFTNDVTPGVSACADGCLEAWPPLTVPEGGSVAAGEGVTGVLGLITGTDGSTQASYDGRPLYYWQGDTEAGQTTGHGVNEVWFVALEDGSVPAAEMTEPADLTLEAATSDLGTFLTGADGMTTYFFAADATPGMSVCEGDCLAAWPPVTVPEGGTVAGGEGVSGVLGLITGTDGSTQVTYDGRPLYYWQGDTEAGQTTGHGVNEVWWVADVSGQLPAG